MPRIINSVSDDRMSYPTRFPVKAVAEIERIAKAGTWFQKRAALARACWELEGAAFSLYVGDPEGQRIEKMPDPAQLADQLYQAREACHKMIGCAKAQGVTVPIGGDTATSGDVRTSARTIEALLNGTVTTLAWLRKAALDAANSCKV